MSNKRMLLIFIPVVLFMFLTSILTLSIIATGPDEDPPTNPIVEDGNEPTFEELMEELNNPELNYSFTSDTLIDSNKVNIAGQSVELPYNADVRLTTGFASTTIIDHELPIITISVGNKRFPSSIYIGTHSGNVLTGYINLGEKGCFDFLKEYLPDQAAKIDALPVKWITKYYLSRLANELKFGEDYEN